MLIPRARARSSSRSGVPGVSSPMMIASRRRSSAASAIVRWRTAVPPVTGSGVSTEGERDRHSIRCQTRDTIPFRRVERPHSSPTVLHLAGEHARLELRRRRARLRAGSVRRRARRRLARADAGLGRPGAAGDGIADLPAVLGALERAGRDGFYDLEIFSDNGTFGTAYPDSLWDVQPEELSRRSRESFRGCWEELRVAAEAAAGEEK